MRSTSLFAITLLAAIAGCGGAFSGSGSARTPLAAQWYDRAKASYRAADFEDARISAGHAIGAAPNDADIKILSARIALARLDFTEALKLTEGLLSSDAHAIRGRAYWYGGDVDHAADELEAFLQDPAIKDNWARDVASLARRGSGRHPFAMDGSLVGMVDMPRAIERVSLGTENVVPCELDGERILALVATGASEVLIDSNTRHEPSWVNLKFDRVEIHDVPALAQDLSSITRQLGVPIKALIGAQLLRHAHATFDRRGDQFVVRRQEAMAPPDASRVPLYYVRGGGMLVRATLTEKDEDSVPLLVDSSRPFPLFLQDSAWKKAGIDIRTLQSTPDAPGVKEGMIPTFRMGGFDLAKLPAIQGGDFSDVANQVDVDLAGVVGANLLSLFRVTFADDGRFMWIEPNPTVLTPEPASAPGAPPKPTTTPPPPAAKGTQPPTLHIP